MATFCRQTIRPIFKGQAVKVALDCLTLKDMTVTLSRNVGDCRWVTCMSIHTGGDRRVPENDLKKSSILFWPEKDIFIVISPHSKQASKQAFSVFFASYSCFLLFRALKPLDARFNKSKHLNYF